MENQEINNSIQEVVSKSEVNPGLSFKAFVKHPLNSKLKSDIGSCGICLYVCAACTLVVGLILQTYASIIDVVVLVALGLGIQLAYSRVCAILTAAYAALNVVVSIIVNGRTGGILLVIAAIYAIQGIFSARKVYKKYQETGVIEDNSKEKFVAMQKAAKDAYKMRKKK
ncbi:MAG: hypothetical protein MJ094_05345 [Saccharofermentans sp.]|nr:hypothetical protein [Saccharofermentans sp.]